MDQNLAEGVQKPEKRRRVNPELLARSMIPTLRIQVQRKFIPIPSLILISFLGQCTHPPGNSIGTLSVLETIWEVIVSTFPKTW